jgi:hypothetical protein
MGVDVGTEVGVGVGVGATVVVGVGAPVAHAETAIEARARTIAGISHFFIVMLPALKAVIEPVLCIKTEEHGEKFHTHRNRSRQACSRASAED